MEEIKFRAWNKKKKFFIENISMNIKICDMNHFNYKELLVFQQYIGLKDKNGKEIYEGDIVKRERYTSHDEYCNVEELKGVIVMHNYAWCVNQKYSNKSCITPLFLEEEFGDLSRIEVIGNVYEDTKLLASLKDE